MLRSTSGRAGSKKGWEFSDPLCSGSWKWGFWKKTSVCCFLGYFQSSVCKFYSLFPGNISPLVSYRLLLKLCLFIRITSMFLTLFLKLIS